MPFTEIGEHALALVLRFVAVDRLGGDAGGLEAAHDPVGAALGAGEDERPVDGLPLQEIGEQPALPGLVDEQNALIDLVDGLGGWRDGDADGVAQELGHKRLDLARHGRREEQRLALRRQLGDDRADVVDEAHVEHAVGFVEHEDLDAIEMDRAVSHQIEKPAGRGDEHVDAARECANLTAHRNAADGERERGPHVAPIGPETLEDLAGELARRAEHEHAAEARLAPHRLRQEMVQDRKRKGGRLAGAGLGDADEVAARENVGNGLFLNRCGDGVVFFGESAGDRRCEAEIMEGIQLHFLSFMRIETGSATKASLPRVAGWIEDAPRDLGCRWG